MARKKFSISNQDDADSRDPSVIPTAIFTLPDVQRKVSNAASAVGRRLNDSVKIMVSATAESAAVETERRKQETALAIALQVCLPFLVAGMGMVGAGIYLDVVQDWNVFVNLPEIFIMVPSLLGLKGNLEMTLASRLSTHANLGNLDTSADIWRMAAANLALVQCQGLVVGFLASVAAMILGWAPEGKFNLDDAFVLCASAVVTASVASSVLGILMIAVILVSRKLGINPDNVATPVAASLGDITTLFLLSIVAEFLFYEDYKWLSPLIAFTFLCTIPLWVYIARREVHTKKILVHGWLPVVSAMIISSVGGLVLDKAIEVYKGIAAFQPVINGIGGNLAGVESSRLATYLHQRAELGALPSEDADDLGCQSPCSLYFGRSIHSTTARVLLGFVVPGQLLFAAAIILSEGSASHTRLSAPFLAGYVLAAFLQVLVLLYVGKLLVFWLWRRKIDPDNSAIPFLTALGDLLGTSLLALAFHLLYISGNLDSDIAQKHRPGK